MNRPALTLAATTLASSMILVDQTAVPLATPDVLGDLGGAIAEGQWILTANVLPLAALMVLGGRLGDLLGLRRVFLAGTVIFACATIGAGAAQDMPMLIAARADPGRRGGADDADGGGDNERRLPAGATRLGARDPRRSVGLLRGAGPGARRPAHVHRLAARLPDQRAARRGRDPAHAVVDPGLPACRGQPAEIDYAGTVTFGLGIAALVFGLSQGQADGWGPPSTVGPLAASVLLLVAFVVIELHVQSPLLEFRLFRHLNFLAANISQFLAGMIELGLGFLMPFFLLLVVGVSPRSQASR